MDAFAEISEIGIGSFARVYRAVDGHTGQHVALKILDIQRSRAMNRDQFNVEMRALAILSAHPHIVTLYRAFVSREHQPVLVMELCETSLAESITLHGAVRPQVALSIAIKLAGALGTAHAAGILHRDVKPANVLVTRYGEPALADFGVARLHQDSAATPAITLHHAAPETIIGDTGDERSDLYSLASTLYELLAGRPPYYVTADEDPLVIQRRVLTDPAPNIRSTNVPIELHDLLRSTLSKDPSHRPASVIEFAQLLRGIEEANGWPATDCIVEGFAQLPPLLRTPSIEHTADSAATRTSIPSLGISDRSFSTVDLSDRGLDPVDGTGSEEVPYARRSVPVERADIPSAPDFGLLSPPSPLEATAGFIHATDSPATPETCLPPPAATSPPDACEGEVAAVWGYGPAGGTGTVMRQESHPPSSTSDQAPSPKRRRFGRKRKDA
ncbi:MAG: serine/threonine-protein kinase [Nitriliruptoraceae bacterium]